MMGKLDYGIDPLTKIVLISGFNTILLWGYYPMIGSIPKIQIVTGPPLAVNHTNIIKFRL